MRNSKEIINVGQTDRYSRLLAKIHGNKHGELRTSEGNSSKRFMFL